MTTNDHTTAPGTAELDPDERRIRNMLRRRVDGSEPLPQQPALKMWMIPAPPAHPPAVPTPTAVPDPEQPTDGAAAPRGGARLPDWRHPKPVLTLVKDDEPEADGELAEPELDQDDEPEADQVDASADAAEPPTTVATAADPETASHIAEMRAGIDQIAKSITADPKQRRRLSVGLYNTGAAGVGYAVGIVPWALGRLTHYGAADPREGVVIGLGLIAVCAVAEIRTRRCRNREQPALVQLVGWIARVPLASTVLALALYGPNATL
ncbi:hypothetical protein [Streptomyces sp. NPDC058657]|uniref:hypothetical protein n=1 Tax=unclassified Streptomyces TaxID=2593676 RepID=UPI003653239B